ncbi:hypothetical protein D3C75_871870 [compost metagenome]
MANDADLPALKQVGLVAASPLILAEQATDIRGVLDNLRRQVVEAVDDCESN